MNGKCRIALYGTVVALFVAVLGWWLFFFSRLGSEMVRRVEDSGARFTTNEVEAVRRAADSWGRMLLAEGSFLVLLLLLGVLLLLRSLRHEVHLHRQRQNFLSAVTHELRTPITTARLHVESLLLGRVPAGKQEAYLATACEELDRLGRMVDHLLEAARASTRPAEMPLERLDLAEFVRESTPRLSRELETPLAVEVDAPAPVEVDANPSALEAILRNLYSNAAKYGGDPPRARVSVTSPAGRPRLLVRDFGPGMSGPDPGRIFEPFVRGKDELVRERSGVGLGLYLVNELARAHGGRVRAGNAEDGSGFTVELLLPIPGGRS